MPREKETFRDNLESLRERFPGREVITMKDAAGYLGVKPERLAADATLPKRVIGRRAEIVLVNFARWLAC